jgi:hypothetical protein
MENLVGKLANIAVDYLFEDQLLLADPVEIIDQKEVTHELLGKRVAIRVKSIQCPEIEKWIMRSEVIFIRSKSAP